MVYNSSTWNFPKNMGWNGEQSADSLITEAHSLSCKLTKLFFADCISCMYTFFKLVLHMAGMHVSLAVSYPSALYPSLLYSGSRPFQLTFRFDCARYSTVENKCVFISLIRRKRYLSLLGGVVFITIRQASGAQKSAVARRCEGSELSREKKNWKHAWVIGI